HADAAVFQIQRMRVPLRTVADNRDLLATDNRKVGVVVVKHLGGHFESPDESTRRPAEAGRYEDSGSVRLQADQTLHRIIPEVVLRVGGDAGHRTLTRAARAAGHRDDTGAHKLGDSVGLQHLEEALNLTFIAGGLNDERLRTDVDDFRAVDVDELHHLHARFTGDV